ncbi:MAG TPA: PqiC family protein [Thermoanaerobaculia bacterium]|nr:PqiC family protein [Thermoanaerobaculia bacterium]
MKKTRALIVLLLVAGCGFFSRTKSSFYSFERIPPTTAPAAAATRGAPVAIDSIELPPGFDRKDVVVRKADHQLEIRGTEQWSASLEPMVLHTLSFNLASRLPEGMVILPGQLRPASEVRSISVSFGEFAAGPESNVVLDARWTISNVPHQERITTTIPSLNSADIADGFSRALAELADRIAAQL